jgi:DNA adenine methylase
MLQIQQDFFLPGKAGSPAAASPINVASVPQRSPFRYPGGKTWFVPAFRNWMASLPKKPHTLVEPYAGGATIALTAVCENWVDHAVLVELDSDVASVWQTIFSDEAKALVEKILTFDLNVENVKRELTEASSDCLHTAFQTILRNRTFHGGILAPGSGLIKSGEAGKGIASRWYPKTLAKRIEALHLVRQRFTVVCGDALASATAYQKDSRCVFFVDPPYTAGGKRAGRRLYTFFDLDHSKLFEFCANTSGDFVMTYDNADEVRALARNQGFQTKLIAMKNTHHAAMSELVVGRNLDWLPTLAH